MSIVTQVRTFSSLMIHVAAASGLAVLREATVSLAYYLASASRKLVRRYGVVPARIPEPPTHPMPTLHRKSLAEFSVPRATILQLPRVCPAHLDAQPSNRAAHA